MDDAKKDLSYKFMEKLLKGKHSDNQLVSGISKLTIESMKSINNNLGNKKSNDKSLSEIKNKLILKEKHIKEIKDLIKNVINKYKEDCEYSTNEKEFSIIIILLDSILRHTSPNHIDSNKTLLQYVNQISKLICGISAKEKDYLIERYIELLKKTKYEEADFLKQIFDEIKKKNIFSDDFNNNLNSIVNSEIPSNTPTLFKKNSLYDN